MAKKVKALIKLYCPAGQANPAPPVGPALGQHGVNIMEFCKKFNEQSKGKEGLVLPVVITVYEDRSFAFVIKSPPVSVLLKQACGIAKASGNTPKEKAGQVSRDKVEEIAKVKLNDLNTEELASAIKMVEGTARSMGIDVVEVAQPATEARGTA
jgi:large subunit ribosomal protein L11